MKLISLIQGIAFCSAMFANCGFDFSSVEKMPAVYRQLRGAIFENSCDKPPFLWENYKHGP